MRVAVVGAGGAGVTCAWLLEPQHDVTLFEASDHLGGHVHTVRSEVDGREHRIELGAEFFFREGYGGLHALLERMRITPVRDRLKVSFQFPERATPVVVPPRDVHALATCLRGGVLRDLVWFQRVGNEGERVVAAEDWSVTVQALFERSGAPRDVIDRFLLPFVAASWGVTREHARSLAAYSVVRVAGLRPSQEAHGYRIEGGFSTYIDALLRDAPRCKVRPSTPIDAVDRDATGLVLRHGDTRERFDAVVLACDWHNAARLCQGAPALAAWHQAFAAFRDSPATVAAHRDRRLMPAMPRHWGASNYDLSTCPHPRTTVWSGRTSRSELFRTWLRLGEAEPQGTQHVARYRHVVVDTGHPARGSPASCTSRRSSRCSTVTAWCAIGRRRWWWGPATGTRRRRWRPTRTRTRRCAPSGGRERSSASSRPRRSSRRCCRGPCSVRPRRAGGCLRPSRR